MAPSEACLPSTAEHEPCAFPVLIVHGLESCRQMSLCRRDIPYPAPRIHALVSSCRLVRVAFESK